MPKIEIVISDSLLLSGCIVDNYKEYCWKCIWNPKNDCYGKHLYHKIIDKMNARDMVDYDYDKPNPPKYTESGTG